MLYCMYYTMMQLCQERQQNKCGPGCRCENCSNAPCVTGTQQQGLVQTEEEKLLHNDSLRKEYGEVCVSDE